jgi:hypothetical protein
VVAVNLPELGELRDLARALGWMGGLAYLADLAIDRMVAPWVRSVRHALAARRLELSIEQAIAERGPVTFRGSGGPLPLPPAALRMPHRTIFHHVEWTCVDCGHTQRMPFPDETPCPGPARGRA